MLRRTESRFRKRVEWLPPIAGFHSIPSPASQLCFKLLQRNVPSRFGEQQTCTRFQGLGRLAEEGSGCVHFVHHCESQREINVACQIGEGHRIFGCPTGFDPVYQAALRRAVTLAVHADTDIRESAVVSCSKGGGRGCA